MWQSATQCAFGRLDGKWVKPAVMSSYVSTDTCHHRISGGGEIMLEQYRGMFAQKPDLMALYKCADIEDLVKHKHCGLPSIYTLLKSGSDMPEKLNHKVMALGAMHGSAGVGPEDLVIDMERSLVECYTFFVELMRTSIEQNAPVTPFYVIDDNILGLHEEPSGLQSFLENADIADL
ncbi:unnamed protein product (mitochondrion) [Plasmodiophora brassicae]|uniref:Uncharacterized protein n=1 Tax=Plasmodiophora brassicae TaxID=37360 RepID=A0A3P3Y7A1_PLABS|nr:unnamed protein product [Plasmodiophora brassicae]